MYDRSTLRCVSNPSRYTRSRAQKAARWRVAVKGEQPKSVEGLTHHYSASPSLHLLLAAWDARCTRKRQRGGLFSHCVLLLGLFSLAER
eukprot:scaffold7785_cov57-Phaeocystis_antarctica.AAC.1